MSPAWTRTLYPTSLPQTNWRWSTVRANFRMATFRTEAVIAFQEEPPSADFGSHWSPLQRVITRRATEPKGAFFTGDDSILARRDPSAHYAPRPRREVGYQEPLALRAETERSICTPSITLKQHRPIRYAHAYRPALLNPLGK